MNRNVRIASELVRLAKSIVAAPRGDYRKMTRYDQYERDEMADSSVQSPANDPVVRLEAEYDRVKSLLDSNAITEIPEDLADDLADAETIIETPRPTGKMRKDAETLVRMFGYADQARMDALKQAIALKHEVDELYDQAIDNHAPYYDESLHDYKSFMRNTFEFYVNDCGMRELGYYKYQFQKAIDEWRRAPNIANWVVSIFNSGEQGESDVRSLGCDPEECSFHYLMNHAENLKYSLEKMGYKYNDGYQYDAFSTQFLR